MVARVGGGRHLAVAVAVAGVGGGRHSAVAVGASAAEGTQRRRGAQLSHLLQSFPEPRRSTKPFALLFLTTPTPSIQSFTHLVAFSWQSCTCSAQYGGATLGQM